MPSPADLITLRTMLGMGRMGDKPTTNEMVAMPENIRSLMRLEGMGFALMHVHRSNGMPYARFVATEQGAQYAIDCAYKLKEPFRNENA